MSLNIGSFFGAESLQLAAPFASRLLFGEPKNEKQREFENAVRKREHLIMTQRAKRTHAKQGYKEYKSLAFDEWNKILLANQQSHNDKIAEYRFAQADAFKKSIKLHGSSKASGQVSRGRNKREVLDKLSAFDKSNSLAKALVTNAWETDNSNKTATDRYKIAVKNAYTRSGIGVPYGLPSKIEAPARDNSPWLNLLKGITGDIFNPPIDVTKGMSRN